MHKHNGTIQMVVFDMAGTTVNENNVVYKTLQATINEAGFSFSLDEVLKHGAGKEKLKAIEDIIATAPEGAADVDAKALYKVFSAKLEKAYNEMELLPHAGAEDLFEQLRSRQIKVVLNTGYNRATATSILQNLHWHTGDQIDALVTASDVERNRPHPDMILAAMKMFGIDDAEHVAKVGDSAIDIEEGKNAGCGLSIGITTGAHTYQQLQAAQPDYIIDSLADLLPLL